MAERKFDYSKLPKIERGFNAPLILKGNCHMLVDSGVEFHGVVFPGSIFGITIRTTNASEIVREEEGSLGEPLSVPSFTHTPLFLDETQLSGFYLTSEEGGFSYKFNLLATSQVGATLLVESTRTLEITDLSR